MSDAHDGFLQFHLFYLSLNPEGTLMWHLYLCSWFANCVCVCSCVYFCHNHLSVSDTCDFDRYRHQRCVREGESHAYIWLPLFIYVVAFDISYILGWSSALCFHTTQLSIYLSFHWVGLEFGKFHAAPWMDVSVLLEQWWQSLSIVNKTYHCKLSAASPVCQH